MATHPFRPPYPNLVADPPHRRLEACVAVPVRDEAERLEAALAALAGQRDRDGRPLAPERYEVVLLLNNCTDASAAVARAFARARPELRLHAVEVDLPPAEAHVGRARRLAMDEAYRRLALVGRPSRGVVLTTDGDTRVAPDWIAATLDEMARGVDGVGGRIMLCPHEGALLPPRARRNFLLYVGYRRAIEELRHLLVPEPHDPPPRHHQHWGGSLAVTAGAYARAGGLPAVPKLEDVALYRAIRRMDGRFRHSPRVRVHTSARTLGRAGGGVADTLRACAGFAARNEPLLVEGAASIERRFRRQARLRRLWRAAQRGEGVARERCGDLGRLADELGFVVDRLADLLHRRPFGHLVEEAGLYRDGSEDDVPEPEEVGAALNDLRRRRERLRRTGLIPATA